MRRAWVGSRVFHSSHRHVPPLSVLGLLKKSWRTCGCSLRNVPTGLIPGHYQEAGPDVKRENAENGRPGKSRRGLARRAAEHRGLTWRPVSIKCPRVPSAFPGSSVVEQETVNLLVVGSNPTRGAMDAQARQQWRVFFVPKRRKGMFDKPIFQYLQKLAFRGIHI